MAYKGLTAKDNPKPFTSTNQPANRGRQKTRKWREILEELSERESTVKMPVNGVVIDAAGELKQLMPPEMYANWLDIKLFLSKCPKVVKIVEDKEVKTDILAEFKIPTHEQIMIKTLQEALKEGKSTGNRDLLAKIMGEFAPSKVELGKDVKIKFT